MKPDITKEDFIKSYRFLRIPGGWAGESFSKARLLIYFVMRDLEEELVRIYETEYTVPMTAKFLKASYEGLSIEKGNKLIVENDKKLADFLVEWDDENKIVKTEMIKEMKADFEEVSTEVLHLQNEAIERGWYLL